MAKPIYNIGGTSQGEFGIRVGQDGVGELRLIHDGVDGAIQNDTGKLYLKTGSSTGLVVAFSDGVDEGDVTFAAPDATSDKEIQVFGGAWVTDFDTSEPTHGVRLGGAYLALESTDISLQLSAAQVGCRVVVAGLTERGNAILAVEAPPTPDYIVNVTNSVDVTIYSGGTLPSAWVNVCDLLTNTQNVAANTATIFYELLVENTGTKDGVFEIGISLNGAAPTAVNSVQYLLSAGIKQIYANTSINAAFIANGTTARLQARGISAQATGFSVVARNSQRPSRLKVSVVGTGGGAIGANPTASVGLTAVNGTALTWIRSDGAPALSQAIVPTWSALHTFSLTPVVPNDSWTYAKIQNVSATSRVLGRITSGAGDIEELTGANLVTIIGSGIPAAANPTASVGLTAVNGSALTWMRSDAAPALSVSITPTWSATHTFSLTPVVPNDSWTYAKIQNVSATSRVLGRITTGAGDIEELTGANLVTIIGSGIPAAANPSGLIGMSAVNGVATTWLRSDGLHAIDPAIVPTWSGAHTFNGAVNYTSLFKASGVEGLEGQVWASQGVGQPPTWRNAGSGSIDLTFKFNTGVAGTDPGNQAFGLNSATYSAVTQLVFDVLTVANFDTSTILSILAVGNRIYIQQINDANRAAVFEVTGVATDMTGWWKVPVSFIKTTVAGTLYQSNANCTAVFILSSSSTTVASPTGTVGLTVVNGSASTAMRSDGAPPLSQAIAPTWSATHTFSLTPVVPNDSWTYAKIQNVSATSRVLGRITSGAGDIEELTATDLTTILGSNIPAAANPSGLIGMAAVNGVATTWLRSDGRHAIDPAIVPTWTGAHTFTSLITTVSNTGGPVIKYIDGDAATDDKNWRTRNNNGAYIVSSENDAGTEIGQAINFTKVSGVITTQNFGNATHNPTYGFLGTGLATINGQASIGDGSANGDRLRLRNSSAVGVATNYHHYFNIASNTQLYLYGWDGTNATIGTFRIGHPQVFFADGTAANPVIAFNSDQDNGLYYIGTNNWGASAGGAKVMEWLAAASGAAKVADTGGTMQLVGFRPLPVSSTTTTLAIGDVGKCIPLAADINIPISVFAAGDIVSVYNDSGTNTRSITITAGGTVRKSGTTTTGPLTLAVRGFATLWFRSGGATPEVICIGDV